MLGQVTAKEKVRHRLITLYHRLEERLSSLEAELYLEADPSVIATIAAQELFRALQENHEALVYLLQEEVWDVPHEWGRQ